MTRAVESFRAARCSAILILGTPFTIQSAGGAPGFSLFTGKPPGIERCRMFGEASQRQHVELSRIVPERTFGADVAAHPDRAMEPSVSLAV